MTLAEEHYNKVKKLWMASGISEAQIIAAEKVQVQQAQQTAGQQAFTPNYDISTWPVLAKWFANFRLPEDRGLGDICERKILGFKGKVAAYWFKKITDIDCGCEVRRETFNFLYPFRRAQEVNPDTLNLTLDPNRFVPPIRRKKFYGLTTGQGGASLNGAIFRYEGELLLAYRTSWAGAQCHIAQLDDDYSVKKTTRIQLNHARSAYGREDPRLFVHNNRLYMAYIGVVSQNRSVHTNQMYARLAKSPSGDWYAEEIFYPDYDHRNSWEKNWQFFSYGGSLLAIYSIAPHVILRIDGNRATELCRSSNTFKWAGGHLRGGASPFLVGGRFYSWFHGCYGKHSSRRYNVGVYTFEAKPPFTILQQTPHPIIDDSPEERTDNYCSVRFPGGAILENGVWRVSSGAQDRWIEWAEWSATDIDRALQSR